MADKIVAIPETITLEPIEVLDKEAIAEGKKDATKLLTLKMYVRGPGCPVPISIDADNIFAEYEENYPDPQSREAGLSRYIARARRAEYLLRRDLLCLVIPELPLEAADVLAATDGAGEQLLVRGKWMSAPVEVDNEETIEGVDTTEGEVARVGETGQLTSLTLVPSTQE